MNATAEQEAINARSLLKGEENPIRIVRIVSGTTTTYSDQLRLADGFLDAFESFWDGSNPQISLVTPDEMVERFRSDLFSFPRVGVSVRPLSDFSSVLSELNASAIDKISLRFLLFIIIAAEYPEGHTLILDADVFPVSVFSQSMLFDLAQETLSGSGDYAVGTPVGLFSGAIAAAWLNNLDNQTRGQSAMRRRALVEACSAAELLFWRITRHRPSLCEITPETRWRKLAENGWEQQPWKQPNPPLFVHFRGAGESPELSLSALYAALHR